MLTTSISILLLALPQNGKDPLSKSFQNWFKVVAKGRLASGGKSWHMRSPLLPNALRKGLPSAAAPYDRLQESYAILRLLADRGTYEDGERLLSVLDLHWKKRTSDQSVLAAIKGFILEELGNPAVPPRIGVQAAVVDRIKKGIIGVDGPGKTKAWQHREAELAAKLLPLLGAFHKTRFRPQLEEFCRRADLPLKLAAARGLATMNASSSMRCIAGILAGMDDVDAVRDTLDILLALDLHRDDEAKTADEDAVLDICYKAVRRCDKPRVKECFLPVFTKFRRKPSVPFLLGELRKAHAMLDARKAKVPTALPFWLAGVHECLEDLTGFSAPSYALGKWERFWKREAEGFVVQKARTVENGTTSAKGFFGIPVKGRHVLFVLDTSSSMSGSMPRRSLSAFDKSVSRLHRAKEELLEAVRALPEEVAFNVICFSHDARAWRPKAQKATKKRKAALARYLRGVVADGGTDLLLGLERGLENRVHLLQSRDRPSVDEVFVLSDGYPSARPSFILEKVSEWNTGRVARINTVYLGGYDPDPDHTRFPGRVLNPIEFMKELARQNHGRFRQIK